MSGINEQELKIRNQINDLLDGKPAYLKGFVNFMNDSSIRTKYNYIIIVLRFVNKLNKDISEYDFDDFNNYIADFKYKDNGEEQGKSYQITTYSALKKFCEYLYVSKKIPEFYMLNIKKPKFSESQKTIEKRSNAYLDENEIKKMLKHSGDNTSSKRDLDYRMKYRNQAIIYLFLGTGMRCSALTSLDIEDVDLKNKIVTVTEKGNKVRHYNISDEVCKHIDIWLTSRLTMSFPVQYKSKALFISHNGERMTSTGINYIIKQISSKVTDKNISAHKLRASYGTQLYNKTNDIYFVQDCMGHSSPTTTELYIRDKKYNTKKASEIMEKLMK